MYASIRFRVLGNDMFCFQLSDKYQEYITDSEREAFLAKLQEVEDWLYEDGEDETKGVYVAKLEELKKVLYMMTLYCAGKKSFLKILF